jgi:uncharacterized protein YbjT (DUF2867 family)
MPSKTAVIAGSTGLVGKELLQLLLNDSDYTRVYSIVRKPTAHADRKLTEIVISYDQLPYALAEIKSADDVFCCLGTTMKVAGSKEAFRKVDYEYPLALASWAKQIKARHFLMISAMGADPASSIFYNKVKGEAERDIALNSIPAITFFRPSLLLGDRKENRPGEKIGIVVAKALSFAFVGPLKNYKGIEVTKVAAAMLAAARQEKTGKEIILSGQMQ